MVKEFMVKYKERATGRLIVSKVKAFDIEDIKKKFEMDIFKGCEIISITECEF